MQKIFTFLMLWSALMVAGAARGQGKNYCSEGHRRSAARQALTTVKEQKLMQKYDVNFYKLDVALERTSTYIAGNTLIKAKSKVAALDTFAFELHQDLLIDSVLINGQKKVVTRQGNLALIKLTPAIANGNAVNALVYYKGTPPPLQSAAIGGGMTSAVSQTWGNSVTWSLSQPFSAYEWFPVKQDLTDKADSSEVWITTSAANKAGSNGILKQTVTLPGGKKRYEWKSKYPIDYYLISVSVSDYVEYNLVANPVGAPGPVLIQNYIYSNPGTLTQYQADINDTKLFIEKFSEIYGLYPFYKEKYGHCMAPFSGGMEHQTMTTQGLFEFTLTSHELAHQWFGDNVTCGSWRDIWLNESFANYSEYVALENLRPAQKRAWMDGSHNYVLSQTGGSVYVPASDSTNVNRIFDGRLTYDKGGAVIHMLRFEINNDTLFFRILKRYQQQFKNSTAKTPNFKQLAETITGKNLTQFFNQWIYGEGYPTFNITWNQIGKDLVLRSSQVASKATVTPFFQTSVEYKLLRASGDTIIRVPQNSAVQNYTIKVGGTVTGIQVDPNQWILNGTGTVTKNTSLVNGIKEGIAQSEVLIFPNPADAFIQVSNLDFAAETIEIFDVAGRSVKKYPISATQVKIEVSDLAKGSYILKISGRDKTSTSHFQKL